MERRMTPTILLYSVPADVHRRIASLCLSLGIDCRKIARARFMQSIGCHAGIPGFSRSSERYEGEELQEPMMVFAGLPERLLDCFLARYKKEDIPAIMCKAIITPHNRDWNALALSRELLRERSEMENAKL